MEETSLPSNWSLQLFPREVIWEEMMNDCAYPYLSYIFSDLSIYSDTSVGIGHMHSTLFYDSN